MNQSNLVSNAFRANMGRLANWLLSCPHRTTTFPRTLRANEGSTTGQSVRTETYIVCLDCGIRLPYDWDRMQVAKRGSACSRGRRRTNGLPRESDAIERRAAAAHPRPAGPQFHESR